jgi:hypothetical protein
MNQAAAVKLSTELPCVRWIPALRFLKLSVSLGSTVERRRPGKGVVYLTDSRRVAVRACHSASTSTGGQQPSAECGRQV